jgi:hypothetical protein
MVAAAFRLIDPTFILSGFPIDQLGDFRSLNFQGSVMKMRATSICRKS